MPEAPNSSLRPATAEDTVFLQAVYASTRAEELAFTGWSGEQKARFCALQFHAQDTHYRQHYPSAQYFVILCENHPVGRLYVDHWENEIRIMDITVLTEYRGRGIGNHLLRMLMAEAEAANKVLSIHVEIMNPARRLYERLGFQMREDKGVHLLMEWTPVR